MLAFALLLTGCPKIGNFNLDKYMPTVEWKTLDVKHIDFDGADVDFVFTVRNPNPIKVTLASFNYDLDLAGANFAKGKDKDGLTLKAEGKTPLRVPVSVTFSELFSLASNVGNADNVPFHFTGKIGFNTPLGEVKVPFDREGDFPVLRRPKFQVQDVRLTDFSLLENKAKLAVDLGVSHEQGSNVGFADFNYTIFVKGEKVATGKLAALDPVAAGKTVKVTLPVNINLLEAGTAVKEVLQDKDQVRVRIDADMNVATPFGTLPLDISEHKDVKLNR